MCVILVDSFAQKNNDCIFHTYVEQACVIKWNKLESKGDISPAFFSFTPGILYFFECLWGRGAAGTLQGTQL